MFNSKSTKAFTLIELLVVIGLIAVLASGIGLAFSGGDKANALQGAQGTLQSLASAVRGQAALAGRKAALLVNVDSGTSFDQQRYLRSFVIATRNTADSQWIVIGDEITLPSGIYLVPSAAAGQVSSIDAAYKTSQNVTVSSPLTLKYSDETTSYPGSYAVVLVLDSRGAKLSSGAGSSSQLVLSPAEIDPSDPSNLKLKFITPALVRGAVISSYGVLTPINDASGF